MDQLLPYLTITPEGAIAVVISATIIYFVFTLVIGVWWKHLRLANSPFTFALTLLLGAVTARTTLGDTPTLAGGLISIATLLFWEVVVNAAQNARRGDEAGRRGTVVMVGGVVEREELRRHGIQPADMYGALRRAGVRRLDQVAAVVLEGDGSFTVLRSGDAVDPELLVGVQGAERLPDGTVARR